MARTGSWPLKARIEHYSIPVTESGCWLWIGARDGAGYGVLHMPTNRRFGAHRASWIAHRGDIPEGLWVLHHCDVPICVNPDHLFLGTNADNVRDSYSKGRHVTHLPRTRARRANATGATYVKRARKWQAQITIAGENIYLGCFPTKDEATAAYRAARANLSA